VKSRKSRHGDRETRRHGKDGRGDRETRRHGEKTSDLRVSASAAPGTVGSLSNSPLTSPRPRVSPSPRRPFPLITLLTDFGLADYFVGAMKGVIFSVNPEARLADITHEIPPQDIAAAAFTLLAAYAAFPTQTIHVAVVDPGVGSSRRPILVVTGNHIFVGPDNGIFSYIIDREQEARVFHITNEKHFRHPVSATFHGRDIFAPVAGALSLGVQAEKLGVEIKDHVRMASLVPDTLGKGRLGARIIHIDRFGNCITNLTPQELTIEMIKGGARLVIKGKKIDAFRQFFATESDHREELFAIWGSAGFLEIAAQNRSAAKELKVERGEKVVVLTDRVARASRP
jgi:S-adenosylmethionine hydrolase